MMKRWVWHRRVIGTSKRATFNTGFNDLQQSAQGMCAQSTTGNNSSSGWHGGPGSSSLVTDRPNLATSYATSSFGEEQHVRSLMIQPR